MKGFLSEVVKAPEPRRIAILAGNSAATQNEVALHLLRAGSRLDFGAIKSGKQIRPLRLASKAFLCGAAHDDPQQK